MVWDEIPVTHSTKARRYRLMNETIPAMATASAGTDDLYMSDRVSLGAVAKDAQHDG